MITITIDKKTNDLTKTKKTSVKEVTSILHGVSNYTIGFYVDEAGRNQAFVQIPRKDGTFVKFDYDQLIILNAPDTSKIDWNKISK